MALAGLAKARSLDKNFCFNSELSELSELPEGSAITWHWRISYLLQGDDFTGERVGRGAAGAGLRG